MKKTKKITAAALALWLAAIMNVMPFAAGGSQSGGQGLEPGAAAVVADKDEAVYARLSANGEVRGVYVVNHFTLKGGGVFSDFGDYSSVVNLTDLGPLTISGGEVSLSADGENFFYQGNLEGGDLPWDYRIEHMIDGVEVLPQNLAGQSGNLEIRITSARNGGASDVFRDNYMQQITVSLDIYKCQNISASGATSAIVGKNRVLVFTVMPGSDAEIKITAEATDFEMAGIEIAAMPFSMEFEVPDTEAMIDDFVKLSDGIAELDGGADALCQGAAELCEGAAELKAGSSEVGDGLSELSNGMEKLSEGAAELCGGAAELKAGSSDFGSGLRQLDANSVRLTEASAQIGEALSQIANGLRDSASSSPAESAMADLAQLPEGLTRLADGLSQVSGGMNQFKEGYSQAYGALDSAIAAIPEPQITEEQMFGLLLGADEAERVLIGHLIESYAAAMTVKGTYEYVKTAFASVDATMETLSESIDFISASLQNIAGQIGVALDGGDMDEMMDQMRQLTDGISRIAENYAGFHGGLAAYAQGISELADGYGALDFGVSELGGGMAEIYGGMAELHAGARDLAGGYGEFDAGLADFADGMDALHEGLAELHGGTAQMAEETAGMPQLFQDEIENILAEYTGRDFEPVSFTSDKNKNTSFVQFAFMTDPIEKPKTETAPKAGEKQPGFLERLLALFGG